MSGVPFSSGPYSIEAVTRPSMVCAPVRTANRSPIPWSKTVSGGTRESMQDTIVANGSCPAATRSRRSVSWSGCSRCPATQWRLPASSLAHACAGDNRGSPTHRLYPTPRHSRSAAGSPAADGALTDDLRSSYSAAASVGQGSGWHYTIQEDRCKDPDDLINILG